MRYLAGSEDGSRSGRIGSIGRGGSRVVAIRSRIDAAWSRKSHLGSGISPVSFLAKPSHSRRMLSVLTLINSDSLPASAPGPIELFQDGELALHLTCFFSVLLSNRTFGPAIAD